ncbi:MAG: ankyrin repeat domain-containing protein [Chlamydiales bacterium]|nr:ankyrin repeat domain-containing protein [Chlamydiales bacterium]
MDIFFTNNALSWSLGRKIKIALLAKILLKKFKDIVGWNLWWSESLNWLIQCFKKKNRCFLSKKTNHLPGKKQVTNPIFLFFLLKEAVESGDCDVVRYLLDRKDLSLLPTWGLSLVESACNRLDIAMINLLINSKLLRFVYADLTPLLQDAVEKGHYEVTDCLLSCTEIPRLPKEGLSLLYIACKRQDIQTVECLLKYHLDPSVKNDLSSLEAENLQWRETTSDHEATPLEAAVKCGNIRLVQLLLDGGALINQRSREGKTPLFHAVCARQEEMALYLIERGASLSMRDGKDGLILSQAISSSLYLVVKTLVKRGVSLISPYVREGSCLHDAAHIADPRFLEFLLENRGKKIINTQFCKSSGTPLKIAVENGYFEHVRLLVTAGADLFLQDSGGKNILFYATKAFKEELEFCKDRRCPVEVQKRVQRLEVRGKIFEFLREKVASSRSTPPSLVNEEETFYTLSEHLEPLFGLENLEQDFLSLD